MDKRFLDVRDHILLVSRLREWRLSTARTVGACALKQVEFVGRPYFIVEIKLLNMTAQTAPWEHETECCYNTTWTSRTPSSIFVNRCFIVRTTTRTTTRTHALIRMNKINAVQETARRRVCRLQ
jgi:hypothetical protein